MLQLKPPCVISPTPSAADDDSFLLRLRDHQTTNGNLNLNDRPESDNFTKVGNFESPLRPFSAIADSRVAKVILGFGSTKFDPWKNKESI